KGDVSLADSIFKSVLLKSKKMIPGYSTLRVKREANYYIGYNYRQSGKYDSAQVYLENCMNYSLKLDRDRESGFLINATLYLGMIKEMSEEYSAAKMYYEKVLDMRESGNSHSLAETYLERIEK
ncbi:MAG: tetratricopeptide repeat protein, partial [Ignavibacteriaceae bacterium]